MKLTLRQLQGIIAECTGVLLAEVRCAKCNGEDNPYAEPNQPDGTWVCRDCRQKFGIKEQPPEAPKSRGSVFKVMEDDHNNQIRIHIFRDVEHFYEYMTDDFDDFDSDEFEDMGMFTDGNGNSWTEYTGFPEWDHTKE